MNNSESYLKYMDKLTLKKLGDSSEAGLWITSLPVPASATKNRSLALTITQRHTEPRVYIKEIGTGYPKKPVIQGDYWCRRQ